MEKSSFLKICVENIEEPWFDEAKVTHVVMYVISTFSRFRGTEIKVLVAGSMLGPIILIRIEFINLIGMEK